MQAKVTVHKAFEIGRIDPRVYGGFIEHLGRAVYQGIYEPDHPGADGDGFRSDVAELIRALDMPVTRYPGGNFVSGYRWEDGVGPVEQRPVRPDLAWMALEPNTFGTDEFIRWCRRAGTEPMLAVNLGTRGAAEAQALVEYCNFPGGTSWSDRRRANGSEEPHRVRLWCLGNEMDGAWQIGHKTAREYARAAHEAGKMMKWTDPSIELVVCGSSHYGMPTFGEWEATVLEECYDIADYLSLHTYCAKEGDDYAGFLGLPHRMERFIEEAIACCDYARARRRADRKIHLSFDEWNVWYHSFGAERHTPEWVVGRPILEDVYTMADVLVAGCMMNVILNHADRVRIACLAQSVNVIAPVMTEKGGRAWKQTIYYPFLLASRHGRGAALRCLVESPTYDRPVAGVPYLSVSVIRNEAEGCVNCFLVNRSLDEVLEVTLELEGFEPQAVVEQLEIRHDDLEAVNDAAAERVAPVPAAGAALEGRTLRVSLKPASWNMIRVKAD